MRKLIVMIFLVLAGLVYGVRDLTTNEDTIIAVGPLVDLTDGSTPEGAMTVTNISVELTTENDAGTVPTRQAFTPTASGGVNDMVLVASSTTGIYSLELTAAQLNFTGYLVVSIIDVDVMRTWSRSFRVTAANVVDSGYGTAFLNILLADGVTHTIDKLVIDAGTGNALTVLSQGGNGHAAVFTGNGSGEGLSVQGGATGHGFEVTGGGGATGPFHGMKITGGTAGDGLRATGAGVGSGMFSTSTSSGAGAKFAGGDAEGDGITITGGGDNGVGMSVTAGNDAHGITVAGGGGPTGPFNAINLTAGTAGYGLSGTFDITLLAAIASDVWSAADTGANIATGTMGKYAGRRGRR